MKTIEQVADIIITEGLGYAVTEYISFNAIQDKELSELWEKAYTALKDVELFMDKKLGDDWEWG